MVPDYYTKTELPLRLAFFWMSSNVCSVVASFIAYGVLHLRGHLGKAGWRWLFLVECVSLSNFVVLHIAHGKISGVVSR